MLGASYKLTYGQVCPVTGIARAVSTGSDPRSQKAPSGLKANPNALPPLSTFQAPSQMHMFIWDLLAGMLTSQLHAPTPMDTIEKREAGVAHSFINKVDLDLGCIFKFSVCSEATGKLNGFTCTGETLIPLPERKH